jgi:halogenation protein CepH
MTSSTAELFDVIVVGGGPGGSTAASLVAMQGHRVLLLEKEAFPRYQIGESLLPATVHGICGLLGVSSELHKAGFLKKYGGTFRWGSDPEPWSFPFAFSPRMARSTFAYQVERMKFDDILLKHSSKVGVEVREECSVVQVIEDEERVRGVVYTDAAGEQHTAEARFVVDASGNKSRIHKSVGGTRTYSEFFQNIALFGYFTGGERLPEPKSGNIFCEAFDEGWFWYIPLSDDLTSVGVVVNRDFADQLQGDQEEALLRFIERAPRIRKMLASANRVTEGPYGQIRVRKDYSYLNNRFWRDGMVLVGDSACFVDPVFSSGVHLATYSAMLAARSINSVLAGLVGEERSFGEFEARYRREYGLFYEFLMSFYDMNADDQSYYWQARKVTNCADSELAAFVELVGGVSSYDSTLVDVDSARARLASTATAFGESMAGEDRPEDTGTSAFHQSAFVGAVLSEGVSVATRVMTGHTWSEEAPLFEGGLVPSADGMKWMEPAVPPQTS